MRKGISMKTEIAKTIIKYREDNNLSQRQLAKKLKIDNSYIARIENGEVKKLSIPFLIKLSEETKINIDILMAKSSYSYREIEVLGINKTDINMYECFASNKLIKNYLIKDEYENTRISVLKIMEAYKKDEINIEQTLGLLSCMLSENMYDYLTKEEIKKLKIDNPMN